MQVAAPSRFTIVRPICSCEIHRLALDESFSGSIRRVQSALHFVEDGATDPPMDFFCGAISRRKPSPAWIAPSCLGLTRAPAGNKRYDTPGFFRFRKIELIEPMGPETYIYLSNRDNLLTVRISSETYLAIPSMSAMGVATPI